MATTTGIGVSQTLAIDLAKPGIPKVVYAMQGEGYTRTVSLRISDDGVEWTPPSDAAYQVSYCKPDGKGGTYSSYTTDTTKPAVEISGGRLNVVLIPQMLQVAGRVRVEVHMQHAAIMPYAERLSTFTFYVMVQASAESGITSTDYWAAARDDKVVLLAGNVGARANVTYTTALSAFFSTPHVGDTVVGRDGYCGKVTEASGTNVVFVSTGNLWVDFAGSGNAVPIPDGQATPGSLIEVKNVDGHYVPTEWGYTPNDVLNNVCFAPNTNIPTTAGETVTIAWAEGIFPHVPRVDEYIVGKNGYYGIVTARDESGATKVTVSSSGMQFVSTSGVLVVRATYSAATNAITADKTFSEIKAARNAGQEVICLYTGKQIMLGTTMLRLDGTPTATVTFRSAVIMDSGITVNLLTVNSSDVWAITQKQIDAAMVQYSGNIDEQPVSSVKAALDALAARKAGASEAGDVTCNIKIGDEGAAPATAQNVGAALELLSYGMPLNARSDFTASGATSAAGWACRASGSGSNYAVVEGFYQILVGNEINYVRVFGVRENATRVVQIWKHGIDYIDPTIEIWRCTAPGATPEMLLRYEAYRGDLTIPNQRWDWQVPDYRSAEKGQVLMASGSDAKPGWGSLPMATASAAGGVKADAKTEDDTVPARIDVDGKLWVKVPDAPLIVTASNIQDDTGTVDYSESEILAAVSAGREVYLRLRMNDFAMGDDIALVLAFGGIFQGHPFFYNIFTTGLANGAMVAMVEGNQVYVYDAGFATSDDLDMFENTIKPQLLPGVTDADNGKFARVVNGAWAAQALTNVSEVGA